MLFCWPFVPLVYVCLVLRITADCGPIACVSWSALAGPESSLQGIKICRPSGTRERTASLPPLLPNHLNPINPKLWKTSGTGWLRIVPVFWHLRSMTANVAENSRNVSLCP